MNLLTQIIIIVSSIPLEFLLGLFILNWFVPKFLFVSRLRPEQDKDLEFKLSDSSSSCSLAIIFVFGLITHLAISFLLRCFFDNWLLVWGLPLIPGLLVTSSIQKVIGDLKFNFSFNLFLWTIVHLLLGISLFSVGEDISTPWRNNYGDLTFHLGIIRSLTLGDNFPPELHLFPGEQLGYPILINYWTALWTCLESGLRSIKLVFAFQWIIVWSLAYFLLQGSKYRCLPWIVLFAGGSYCTMNLFTLDPNAPFSWEVLGKGYPWTVLLTSVWVTQRSAMLGLIVLLAAIRIFESLREKDLKLASFVAIALLAIGFLSHVHLMLVGFMYITLSVLFSIRIKHYLGHTLWMIVAALPGLIFLPFILAKSEISKAIWGWSVGQDNAYKLFIVELVKKFSSSENTPVDWTEIVALGFGYFTSGVWQSIVMWLMNAWQVLLFAAILLMIRGQYQRLLVLAIIFVFGNFLQLSFWDWDQIKFFIGVYIVLVALVPSVPVQGFWRNSALNIAFVLLVIPGLWELGRVVVTEKSSAPFDAQSIKVANDIIKETHPHVVIAAAPNHNSPVLLSGRMIYHGYAGTLWSHGIDSNRIGRARIHKNLELILNCKPQKLDVICPDYFLWTGEEQKFWKLKQLPKGGLYERTASPYLYKIKKK